MWNGNTWGNHHQTKMMLEVESGGTKYSHDAKLLRFGCWWYNVVYNEKITRSLSSHSGGSRIAHIRS
jgi:hypothetical protein